MNINNKINNFNVDIEKEKENNNNYIKTYKKQIRQDIKYFIEKLQLNEVVFIGFTINFFNYINNKELLNDLIITEINDLINYLKEINLIEFVYISKEIHGNAKTIKHKLLNISNEENRIILKNNMEGLNHLHGIIGIRSIIKNNENLILNVTNMLRTRYDDININKLEKKKDILGYWNYCIKENKFENHYFINYSKFYENVYGLFHQRLVPFKVDKIKCLNMNYVPGSYNNIKGLPSLKENSISNNVVILYLIALFFHIKEYRLNNNNIYLKNNKSLYSWLYLSNIEVYLKKNMMQLYKELCGIFKFHLDINDSMGLLVNNTITSINLLLTDFQIISTIEFLENVIEFKDGLYFANYNYFLRFEHNKQIKLNNIYCNKFYNSYYRFLKNKKPINWLSLLKPNFKDDKHLLDFCTNLGYYFNCNLEISTEIKQKTIAIIGASNTGKTSLITNPIINAYTIEKIGLLSDINDNFIFENIENKSIIIADEFKFLKNNRSSLLKLMNNEPMLINKKYKNKNIFINKAPILLLFNDNQNLEFLNDKSFLNRILIYTFTVSINNNYMIEMKSKIIEEVPNIIIYCNNLYFNKYCSMGLKTKYRNYCRDLINKEEKDIILLKNND